MYIMKGTKFRRGLALMLGLMLAAHAPASITAPFKMFDSYAYTGAATVKASSLNVRSGAGTGYQAIGRLAAGTSIRIIGEQKGTDGNTWYQIQYTGSGGAVSTGYVSASYVKLPVSYTTDAGFEAQLTAEGFPESYKDGLRQLHAQYPNWVFKAKNTGLDWNTVIQNEAVLGRNLTSSGSISSWKSVADGAYNWDNSSWTGFDGSSWVAASEDIIRYYMDPRNFLDDTYVFQFLSHEYDQNTQTKEGLSTMVQGTFLSGSTDSTGTGGSNFSGGSSGSGSGSAQVSDKGPGRSSGAYDDSQHGPGVSGGSGSSGTTSGTASGAAASPVSGQSDSVSLEAPQASITPRKHTYVATQVSLSAPGSDETPGTTVSAGQAVAGEQAAPGAQSTGTSQTAPGSQGTSASQTAPGGQGTSASQSAPGAQSTSVPSVSSGGSASYVDIIMSAASQSGVSPYVLAAMILQEQGNEGTSPLISGSYSGYEGYYNFFNVEAYQSGSVSAIQMGLKYASQSGSYGRPWNTVEKSILGGAMNYGDNYVKAGQNTFYLKKFNVQGANLYKHQYMSNIQAAASEGAKLAQAYTDQMKNSALEFHIPVFNNMPEQPCVAPAGDGSPNNKLSGLGAEGYSLTPSFSRDTESYNLIVDTSVSSITVTASAADSRASVTGTGTVALQGGSNDITVTVTAQNGSTRIYTIHVVKQDGGPTAGNGSSPVSDPGSVSSGGASSGSTPAGGASSGSAGPGGGPSAPDGGGGSGPGGSNVTIVEVQS